MSCAEVEAGFQKESTQKNPFQLVQNVIIRSPEETCMSDVSFGGRREISWNLPECRIRLTRLTLLVSSSG